MKKQIETKNAPAAIGPYSQGISSGDFIFISGQIPIDPETGEFAADNIAGQTEQVINNIAAVLAAGDAALEDVVKTTVYLQSMSDFSAMNEVYAKHFGTGCCPARAAFAAAALPKGALVEIEAIAIKPTRH